MRLYRQIIMIKSLLKNTYLTLRKLLIKILFVRKNISRIEPDKVNSILLIRLDRIGDLVVSIPAIKAIKKIFPKARITALLSGFAIDLAKLIPEIDEVIIYRGFFAALAELRNKKFSLAIDLLRDYTLKPALLCHLSGAEITAGFNIGFRGSLFNAGLDIAGEPKAMSKCILDLARFLGKLTGKEEGEIPESDPVLVLTPGAREFGHKFIRENGIKDDEMIFGVVPGAKFPSQCWKKENFAELADWVADKYRAKVVIIASKQEEKLAHRVGFLMRNKPVLAVGLALDKLAGLISLFRLMAANNSGPLHIAAALGVPTVSTMGPTTPDYWWPQGKNHIVIRRDLFCSPCDRAACRGHECLELISVEEMEKAVEILLGDSG